ncbi:MAG: DNA-binding domain-containing protein [Alphaproteobacteria bacterium]
MRLNDVQARFKEIMLDHPDALQTPGDDFAALFTAGDIPLPARLSVYRNNIVGSLTDVMVAGFPLIDNLVGRAFMEKMARSFILKNPPQSGCLNLYGEGFEHFIERFEPAKSLPYRADVARLEIALNAAYYAPDDTPLPPDALARIAADSLAETILLLRKAVRLVTSPYPLEKIRDFCLSSDKGQAETLDISTGGCHLLIDRPALDVRVSTLQESEYIFLSGLLAGQTLGAALEHTLILDETFDVHNALQRFFTLEAFSAINPQ